MSGAAAEQRAAGRWLLREPDLAAQSRLFCFPYAGVGASMFARWPHHVGSMEVCPVQYPGRENRIGEKSFDTFYELVVSLVLALRPLLDIPYALFGHCAGALPAYEMAKRVRDFGVPPPDHVYVSAQLAPHAAPHDRLLGLGEDQLRTELCDIVRERGGEPTVPLVDIAMRVLLDDLGAVRRYEPSDPAALDCPLTAIHWAQDTDVERAQVEEWSAYSPLARVVEIAGGHYEVLANPAQLFDILTDWTCNTPRTRHP